MARNLHSYDKYIRQHRKRHSCTIALRALFEGRDNNPAREEFYNSLISGLKKKNQCWARPSDSDDFGEEVIYSQESPKMEEFSRDFDWDLDRFVEYRSPFKRKESLPIKKPL